MSVHGKILLTSADQRRNGLKGLGNLKGDDKFPSSLQHRFFLYIDSKDAIRQIVYLSRTLP